ncbi:MAG: DUF5010 domain-containing protein [Sedimentisphaerales bacterium]|nr:DUF5010 domain-containing protein [Sedimentisphaerales bacterium]
MVKGRAIMVVCAACVLSGPAAGQRKELPARPPGRCFPLTTREHRDAATFERGAPLVGTTYFYWYDIDSQAHIKNTDGSDALTTHPADMNDLSYKRSSWHEAQLRDMMDAGIDFLMPVYWGVPGDYDGWSFVGLPPLVEAHAALERAGLHPPAIGMFYDTSILSWNRFNTDGSNYRVDLTSDFGKEWFYTAIRDFFSLIPPDKWARIDGKPIVFLYEAAFAGGQDPQRQFTHVKERFEADFGVEPFIVKSSGWQGRADATYSWGGAVSGPIFFEDTAALGPGYDHSAVPGRQPLIVDRRDGQTYIERWTKLLQLPPRQRPWLVHVETWNEWHEGTDVAHSREYGRSYIVLTRLFADMWHAETQLRLGSGYADANEVAWEPGAAKGLSLRPAGGDGNWRTGRYGERNAVVCSPNPHSESVRYLYFDVDDAFAYGLRGQATGVTVTYRDAGCLVFGVEYDSTVAEGPLAGAFRSAGSTAVADASAWKTARFTLPDCGFMGRCNGADLRLFVTGGDLELAVTRVTVSKKQP